MDFAMIEILFIYQLARNPMQAIARRWWCPANGGVNESRISQNGVLV
jgi:hypothetical protein